MTISFIIDNYWSGNSSVLAVQKLIGNYIHQQEKDFDELVSDTTTINTLISGKYEEPFLNRLTDKKYFFFIYLSDGTATDKIYFWNTQAVLPTGALLAEKDGSGFIKLANGYYVWRKKSRGYNKILGLIPVKWNYIIRNDYLKNGFATGDNIENSYDIAEQSSANPVKSKDGSTLFYLNQKSNVVIAQNNPASALLKIIAALLLLLFIHLLAVWLARKTNFLKAVLFLSGAILVLRSISYLFPLPLNFRQFELFDPTIYSSNFILRSLGDVLINAFLFVWFTLFVRNQMLTKNITLHPKSKSTKWLIVAIAIIVLLASTFICGQIIRTLVADSQISFDVINFFTLDRFSLLGFVVICCTTMGYFALSQVIMSFVETAFKRNFYIFYLVLAISGLILLSFNPSFPNINFGLYLLVWLLLYQFLLHNHIFSVFTNRISSSKLVFWLFFFSISITIIIVFENNIKEWRNREHYAETLSSKADSRNETLMNTLLTGFRNDFLSANFYRFQKNTDNRFLKDSLINDNFYAYTNKYDTKVFTFDAKEQALFNEDSASFSTLNTILTTQSKLTGISGLYYFDVSFDRYSYISRKDITDGQGKIMGYIFILANHKESKMDLAYPDLFGQGQHNSIENSPIYSFAIYNKLQLVNSHNDYSFSTRISLQQLPKESFTSIRKKGFNELWYNAGLNSVVIIAKADNFFIESITLFSYLFCSFLLLAAFFWLLNILIRSRIYKKPIQSYWQLSIRRQVHGTIIFISVLSFLVIGIATILFFISRYENNYREKLSTTIRIMENEVRSAFENVAMFDDEIKIYDSVYQNKLEQTISKISRIQGVDINVYDIDGNLQASSISLPYNKGILSKKMDPIAFYHLNNQKEIQYFKDEKIGKLNFVSNYVSVLDDSGKEYAYLNIPYFTSQSKLKQEISNFLVTIINLNAFIFLIAGIIALFITNRITNSFSFISNKMKEVSIGKLNEAIVWNRDDEISELIKEYNKMVAKLDQSAAALAKSEREGAWREMARQVAHEIKNPLTPMKLSLQYLQKTIDENRPNTKELTANVAKTIVEQIDHLSQIAGEFSQFANIGNPHNETVDLHRQLGSIIPLYSNEEAQELNWKPVDREVLINADKTHINRLFTNLIQNAIQAVMENKKARIEIKESIKDKNVLITVKDNGNGIPEDMQAKIFTPYFTTKSSGTGLGLAMCKGIVEEAKGKIWFETESGVGTTFYVELPLAE
jgi:signal transduction histidine kinase